MLPRCLDSWDVYFSSPQGRSFCGLPLSSTFDYPRSFSLHRSRKRFFVRFHRHLRRGVPGSCLLFRGNSWLGSPSAPASAEVPGTTDKGVDVATGCSIATSLPTTVAVGVLTCPDPVHPVCCRRARRLSDDVCQRHQLFSWFISRQSRYRLDTSSSRPRLFCVPTVWEGAPVSMPPMMPSGITSWVGVPVIIKPSCAGTEGWCILSLFVCVITLVLIIRGNLRSPQRPGKEGYIVMSLN